MAKMGRPQKPIDKDAFENLCGLQCSLSEVCTFFDVTDKTLNAWCRRTYKMTFSEVFAIKRGKGKIALRRAQFRMADHNATMAIFLGKQYLGQKDVSRHELSGNDGGPIQTTGDVEVKVYLPENGRDE